MNPFIEIIQEDNDIIICRKPAGIPVQTAKFGQPDMVSQLKNYRAGRKESPEIYVVHRLDQPVEGVMVFAKNQRAAASLSKQIQQKGVDKYYYAVVEGIPAAKEGKLENYLLRDGKGNTSRVVKPETKGAKKAILHYKVLQSARRKETDIMQQKTAGQMDFAQAKAAGQSVFSENSRSLIEIHLETGRHHQIRVQMAHAGHPLVGDKKYNPNSQNGYLPIGLCSVRLAFQHPTTGKRMEFSIKPKGEAFQGYLSIIK